MTQPQIKPEARINAYEGMHVAEIKKSGSTGQKIAVPLFDYDGNGILEGEEVERFNACNFKSEKNKLTIYDRSDNSTLEIRYKDLKELYCEHNGRAMNSFEYGFKFSFNEKGKDKTYTNSSISLLGGFKKAVIDMFKGKVSIEGTSGYNNSLMGNNVDLSVKDTNTDVIDMSGGKLTLENVKAKGLLWGYNATEVETDGKTVVKQDADSKAEIKTK